MIQVTKPFLPPREEYDKYLDGIWQRNWLTNNGPLVNELELKLKEHLQLPHLLYVTNGTIAIQMAIKALQLKGEIITTPFSYVATTSSIVWEGCKPVFVDIDPRTFNIDPSQIESAITKQTSAILATHCFGNPCDIDSIQQIAEKHQLKVIYDAAHCFGTRYKGKSVFAFGDISTTSFHATKLYHTIEGGAVFTSNPELLKKMSFLRNFGHDGPEIFADLGINGKNSEFHAAMGLCNLKYVEQILLHRKEQHLEYNKLLRNSDLQFPAIEPNSHWNYAYYPIVFESEEIALRVMEALNTNWISPRRYFYPSLENMPYIQKQPPCVNSQTISKSILVLPLYHQLTFEEIHFISRIVLRTLNN